MRGVTQRQRHQQRREPISTRTPHAGSDGCPRMRQPPSCVFQPALPMRGVTAHAVRIDAPLVISTRTPHAGSDSGIHSGESRRDISTRTPHAGSDFITGFTAAVANKFQPALPMRGVTRIAIDHHVGIPISTRTPHAGSDRTPGECKRP